MKQGLEAYRKARASFSETVHHKFEMSTSVSDGEQTEPRIHASLSGELRIPAWDALAVGAALGVAAVGAWIASMKR